jgi:single-strand DNA-binding protein
MSLPTTTAIGRLTAEPELRFTPGGKAVINFSIASNARRKNAQTQEWEDGDKIFLRGAVWDQVAENIAESALIKGAEVIAIGELKQREYEHDGQKRTVVEMNVRHFAVEITQFQTVEAHRREKVAAGGDPWGSTPSSFTDEPPF